MRFDVPAAQWLLVEVAVLHHQPETPESEIQSVIRNSASDSSVALGFATIFDFFDAQKARRVRHDRSSETPLLEEAG